MCILLTIGLRRSGEGYHGIRQKSTIVKKQEDMQQNRDKVRRWIGRNEPGEVKKKEHPEDHEQMNQLT